MAYQILVTGASGFVGSALVPYLASAGYSVRAASRMRPVSAIDQVDWVESPNLEEEVDWSPILKGVDVVVHLAGRAHRTSGGDDDDVYDRINHRATRRLADACRWLDIRRLIFLSSIGAQTGSAADHVVCEADQPHPVTGYDRAKLAAELAIRNSGVPHTILRPVVVYGANPKANVALLARMAASPWPLPFASFQNRRSLLAIENLLEAIAFSLDSGSTLDRTFIVADAEPLTLAEMFTVLRSALDRPRNLFAVPPHLFKLLARVARRDILWDRIGRDLVASPEQLMAAGWKPGVDTAQGLARMMRSKYGRGDPQILGGI